MDFLTGWEMSVNSSLADMTELANIDKDLELMYGLVATGLLWPVRNPIEAFSTEAIQALENIAPQGDGILFQFAQAWSPEKLSAARELPLAARRDRKLRSTLDQIITYFGGLPIFLQHVLRKLRISPAYDENDLIQRLLPTIGNLTTVRQLYRTVDLMLAGAENLQSALVSHLRPEELLKPYLTWFIRQHEKIELRGIKQPGGLNGIPLESVYVALRGDRTSSFERQQSHAFLENELNEITESLNQQELSFEERRTLLWQALGKSPWMLSLEERDRPHLFQTDKTEKLSLGEAFCRERWLAILGDPGSGKTTVARWLTLKLAQASLEERERLVVPASQVDPAASRDDLIDLGPVRLPILVRISEFADVCREKPGLLLADFLGYHSWLGRVPAFSQDHADFPGEALPPAQLNLLIKDYLRQGRAVIVLDGLDEISVADNRTNVIQAVEEFISKWIILPSEEEKTHFSALRNRTSSRQADYPAARGGNQIVVTSRIAGYHADPLGGQIAHFTIDPMNDGAVSAFCEAWMNVFYEDWEEAYREAEAFKAAMHDPQNPGVRDLASNPLLLTILALIYQDGQSTLPRQRVNLYQRAVDNLTQVWQQRGHSLQPDEVIYVLTQIAYHIHETYPTGLIEETVLRDLIAKNLAAYRDIPYEHLPLTFNEVVNRFMEILREEVGLLAARGERLYGFLHLSFQEYFAALYLVQTPQTTSTLFAEKLDKPRWREPLLLAFGYISTYWSASERKELINAFLKANDDLKHLLPRSAILLANAMSEMTNQPPEPLIRQMVQSLLDTYSGKENFVSFDLLYTTIEEAFQRLRKTSAALTVETMLVEELQGINHDNWGRGFAAAQVMFKLNWFTAPSTHALLQALPFDSAAWDWVINKSLIQITKTHPEYLPASDFSLRNALQQNKETLAFVKNDVAWLRVITLLFGGFVSHEGSTDEGSTDESSVEFLPNNIYRDALLSQTLLHRLQNESEDQNVSQLEAELRDIWQNATNNRERTEALLGLSALGVPLDTLVNENSASQAEVFESALSYADLMTELLKPLFRKSMIEVKEEIAQSSADETTNVELLRGLARFETGLQTPVAKSAHVFFKQRDALSPLKIALYWAEVFDSLSQADDIPYSVAVILDTVGNKLTPTPEITVKGLALLQEIHWSGDLLRLESFPPHLPLAQPDSIAEALNVIDGAGLPLEIWRCWALGEIAAVLTSQAQDFIPEALAICLKIAQLDFLKDAIQALDPTLMQDTADLQDLYEPIFQRALALTNPLHRARSLWRLIQVLPGSYYIDGLQEAINSTSLIADAQEKSRMYWRLGNMPRLILGKEVLHRQAYRHTFEIADPENKARAFARLVVHFPEQEQHLLALMFDEVEKITDERRRAEMFSQLRSFITPGPELQNRLTAMIDELQAPQMRWLARGQLLPQLFAYKPQPENNESYMLVSLMVCLQELQRTFGHPTELTDIWATLIDKQRRASITNTLCAMGAKNGLKLTSTAANALNVLINQEDMPTLTRLFPLIQEAEPGLQPLLLQWLQSSELSIQQIASLLLAETNFLTANTFPHLIELLDKGEDRLKHRAALALYDKKYNNGLPRFRLSAIGQETLMLMDQTSQNWRQYSPGVKGAIRWIYQNIWIDDGSQLDEWTQQLLKPWHENTLSYASFLMNIHALTREGWNSFLRSLENGNDDVKCLLLLSLIDIANARYSMVFLSTSKNKKLRGLLRTLCLNGNTRVRRWAIEAAGYLPHFDEDEKQLFISLTDETDETLAAQAIVSLGRQTTTGYEEQLQPYLNSNRLNIHNAADAALVRCWLNRFGEEETDEVLSQVIEEMLRTMGNDPDRLYRSVLIGGQTRWYGSFAKNAAKLGGLIVERFPVLLEQILNDLTQSLEGPHKRRGDSKTVEDLLDQTWLKDIIVFDIAETAATRMPAAFANLVDVERLQPLLIRFTRDGGGSERTASVTLLSFMRQLSIEVTDALRNGLNDIVYSQEAVLQAVARFRNVKGDILSKLGTGLFDPSAAFAYATVQLFLALGTAETTSFADRQEIIKLLAKAIEEPSSKREVYVLKQDITTVNLDDGSRSTTDKGTMISHMGSLNSAMYQALVQISGVGGTK